jgi:GTP cyclohydrolase I
LDHGKIEKGVKLILQGLGCDMRDQNFFDTPDRVARLYDEMFNYKEVDYPTFEERYNNFILLRGHEIWGMCPHHLLPVEMSVDVAYIPNGKVLGLSKLCRLLHDINRGPILQEKFTNDVIEKIYEVLPDCKGAACVVTGKHGCAKIRGVHTKGDFRTYSIKGEFQSDPDQERRFLELARNGNGK